MNAPTGTDLHRPARWLLALGLALMPMLSGSPARSGGGMQLAGGAYHIVSVRAELCLEIPDWSRAPRTPVLLRPCRDADNQIFRFIDHDYGRRFAIMPVHNDFCLDVYEGEGMGEGNPLIQWPCEGRANQLFVLHEVGYGVYNIVASHSDQCLEALPEDRVVQHFCHGGESQVWAID